MAGISVSGSHGGRRSVDSEINMIPMIDLLMVTISFLLITAVWVNFHRMEANAAVPGPPTIEPPDPKDETRLHVETSDPAKFVLVWKQGRTVVRSVDVPRETKKSGSIAFPNLAAKVSEEWRSSGAHHDASDRRFDGAVVHAANDMPYSDLIAVMDAVAQPKRSFTAKNKLVERPAFDVTFAVD